MTAPVEKATGRLPVADLRESPLNPRKTFSEESLRELGASMADLGQIQPIVVRPTGPNPRLVKGKWVDAEPWEIVCGHRRARAAALCDIPELDVIARVLTDDQVRALQIVENGQREDVPPSEQAAAVGELAKSLGQEEAAKLVGWPLARVRDLLRLAGLPAWFLQAVDAEAVPLSTAGVVARVPGAVSREKAAACVLLGLIDPEDLEVEWNDGDDWREAAANPSCWGAGEHPVLTVKQAKVLVGDHFSRELKAVPFSRKSLTLVEAAGSCDACPKRAGNDPELVRENVRADICTDPECFENKVAAYRSEEVARAAKKSGATAAEDVSWEKWQTYPKGWCVLDMPIGTSELNDPRDPWVGKKASLTVAELLRFNDKPLSGLPAPAVAFHPQTGKPALLVRTKDARRALEAAGLMGKKERPKAAPKGGEVAGPADQPAYRLFRLTCDGSRYPFAGFEFDAPADATEEEIATAAWEVVAEHVSFGWEEVPAAEADGPGADVRTPTPIEEPFARPGDVVRTSYGTGPYVVKTIDRDGKLGRGGRPCYSMTLTAVHEVKAGVSILNDYQQQAGGRITAPNGDELIVLPKGSEPGPTCWDWCQKYGVVDSKLDRDQQRRWMDGLPPSGEKAAPKLTPKGRAAVNFGGDPSAWADLIPPATSAPGSCSRCPDPATTTVTTRNFGDERVCEPCAVVLRADTQYIPPPAEPAKKKPARAKGAK